MSKHVHNLGMYQTNASSSMKLAACLGQGAAYSSLDSWSLTTAVKVSTSHCKTVVNRLASYDIKDPQSFTQN